MGLKSIHNSCNVLKLQKPLPQNSFWWMRFVSNTYLGQWQTFENFPPDSTSDASVWGEVWRRLPHREKPHHWWQQADMSSKRWESISLIKCVALRTHLKTSESTIPYKLTCNKTWQTVQKLLYSSHAKKFCREGRGRGKDGEGESRSGNCEQQWRRRGGEESWSEQQQGSPRQGETSQPAAPCFCICQPVVRFPNQLLLI